MVHLRLKMFACSDCDYACSDSGSLKRHIKICTGKSNLSSGEFRCKQRLDELCIEYSHNSRFELKNEKGNHIQWDFRFNIGDKMCFIEYNGKQHYEPATFGGMSKEQAQVALERQQLRDKLRQDYCDENNYPLLWIKYDDYDNINKLILDFVTKWGWDGDRKYPLEN